MQQFYYYGLSKGKTSLTHFNPFLWGATKLSRHIPLLACFILFLSLVPSHGQSSVTWQAVGTKGFTAGVAANTSLALAPNGTPFIAFKDGANSNRVSVMKFTGTAWQLVGSAGFSSYEIHSTSIVLDASGTPYVVYQEVNTDESYNIVVKKFNGSSWVALDPSGLTDGAVEYFTLTGSKPSLVLDANGIPYIAYQDNSNRSRAIVKKYDGSAWVTVGNAGFSTSIAQYNTLAMDANGIPHVAFRDNSSSSITVMKLNGASWVNVGNASFSAGTMYAPALAIDGNGVPYVAFSERNNDHKATVMKYTGTTWEIVGAARFSQFVAMDLSLVLDAMGTPYVSYREFSNIDNVKVMKFDGTSWSPLSTARITEGAVNSPSLALGVDGTPYLAYQDGENGDKATLMKFSLLTAPAITTQPASSDVTEGEGTKFSVVATGSSLIYKWQFSTNGGASFSDIGTTPGYSGAHSATLTLVNVPLHYNGYKYRVLISNGAITTSNAANLTVAKGNFAWQVVGAPSISAGKATVTSIDFDNNNTPYIAYRDEAHAGKMTVKKFNGSQWVTVGTEGFSSGATDHISFAIAANGTPYVAFQDKANFNGATVMKFNGSEWVLVGNAGFSRGGTNAIFLALDAAGTPYVAFSDFASSDKTTVMKFNGSGWENVGETGFSDGNATEIQLVIDKDGMAYVAFKDMVNGQNITVMKSGSIGWQVVGKKGFSDGSAPHNSLHMSLKLDANGTPYVAYSKSNSEGAAVMRFNGSEWEYVGERGFSGGQSAYTSMAFDANGQPMIAYWDNTKLNKATVKKYDGTSWVAVGTAGFSAGLAYYLHLAIDRLGTPYVTYADDANGRKATVMKYGVNPNAVPTNISLSKTTVDENVALNTVVGTFTTTDANAGDTHTYTLVSGTGSTDNALFAIDGNSLKIRVSPDYETKSTYSIRVRTDDGKLNGTFEKAFTIQVIDLDEVKPTLTVVAIASSNSDPTWAKVGDVVTVSFTASEPLQTSSSVISGRTATVTQVGTSTTQFTASYTLVNGDHEGPLTFGISYLDVAGNAGAMVTATTDNSKVTSDLTAPRAIISSTAANPTESSPISLTLTFSEKVNGFATDDFLVVNGSITSIVTDDNKVYTVDFTPASNGAVAVTLRPDKAKDAAGNGNEASNTWSVSYKANTNVAPTAITLSRSDLNENNLVGAIIGTFTSTDPDAGDKHTYTLVTGEGDTDNASFTIDGNTLKAALVFDYETKSSLSIRVRTTDNGGLTYDAVKIITINDVQENVTGIGDEKNQMLKVYPNPANQHLSISFDRTIESVSLVNSLGATVLTQQDNSDQIRISLEPLASGVYTVLISSKGKLYSRRIVVAK